MPYLAFKLSMPNRGSWNGKWSGENNVYAIVRTVSPSKKSQLKAKEIADKGSYYYSWSDGWGASVSVDLVDAKQAKHLRKISQGFCGYDWMVQSILDHGYIKT